MEKGIVVYSSISVVHRARKLLKKKQVSTSVVQLPSDLGLQGCSYGMECSMEDMEGILAYSHEKKLKMKGVYKMEETEHGKVYTAYDLS